MESLEFSEDEIKRQLAALGYFNVPEQRMKQFRKDLHKLIEHDRSASGSSSWFTGVSSPSNSDTSDMSSKQSSHPVLPSRYQPHVKYPIQQPKSTQQSDASWLAQSDFSRLPSRTNTSAYLNSESNQTDPVRFTEDGMTSMSLENSSRRPLQSIENQKKEMKFDVSATKSTTPTTITEDSASDDDHGDPSLKSDFKLIRKRKVLRKQRDGTPRVYDESLVEDSASGVHRIHDVSIDDSDPRLSRFAARPRLPPRPHSTKPSSQWKKDSNNDLSSIPDHHLPSYIRPNTSHPHTKNLRKTDPVHRYHQYRDFWTNLKAPGEKSHKNLRWEVKAQMMYKEEPAPKPQRVYVPNTYVVPTSKKRSALRWEVRHAMENGLPLPTTYDIY